MRSCLSPTTLPSIIIEARICKRGTIFYFNFKRGWKRGSIYFFRRKQNHPINNLRRAIIFAKKKLLTELQKTTYYYLFQLAYKFLQIHNTHAHQSLLKGPTSHYAKRKKREFLPLIFWSFSTNPGPPQIILAH